MNTQEHVRAHKGLEWFGLPERNTLLHCVMYCVSEIGSVFVSVSV